MLKRMLSPLLALAMIGLPLSAAQDKKEADRLDNCGTVLKEILDIPDDIPQDLLDKAECVIVYPSVLKAAFVIGGSYGRGAMTCRTGEHYTGPWSAPTMMALEGGSIGFQIGGQATDFGIDFIEMKTVTCLGISGDCSSAQTYCSNSPVSGWQRIESQAQTAVRPIIRGWP